MIKVAIVTLLAFLSPGHAPDIPSTSMAIVSVSGNGTELANAATGVDGQKATDPTTVVAQPNPNTDEASDVHEVVNAAEGTVSAVRAGSWIGIASAAIMLLLSLFRLPALGSLTKKIPNRWRVPAVLALSALAGFLSNVVGGVPWGEAISVALFTGPTAVFHNEFFLNSVLGRRQKRANGSADPKTG